MRILILSHGHPTLSAGGAERAAYSIFEHLKTREEAHYSCFAARAPERFIGHDGVFGAFRGKADEILFCPPPLDPLTGQSSDYNRLKKMIRSIITYARPDVVHIHHFEWIGLEVYEIFKAAGVAVVATLHEYIPICFNYGQMVKTDGRLCHESSPMECSLCYPQHSSGMFFLRSQMFKSFFGFVDRFIAPSSFLAERYVSWGLWPGSIDIIENPLPPASFAEAVVEPDLVRGDRRLKIGFFGQLNKFKGLDVLIRAIKSLTSDESKNMTIGVHGANLEMQESSFQESMRGAFRELRETISYFGPYENRSVISLMKNYDRVVVPSIWWENSPVVIQEARFAGTPLILSDLGGMAEKSNVSKINELFKVGDFVSLAQIMVRLSKTEVRPRMDPSDALREHSAAIDSIIKNYRSARSLKNRQA